MPAVGDDLHSSPFAVLAFHVFASSKAKRVGPFHISAKPVDAARRNSGGVTAFFPDKLSVAVFGGLRRQRRGKHLARFGMCSGQHQNIAHTALNNLRLDRRHPRKPIAAFGTPTVEEQPGIAGSIDTFGPRLVAQFEFQNQMIITISLVRDDPAITVTRNMKQAILDCEHLIRI